MRPEILVLFALLGLSISSTTTYNGFKVYKVTSKTERENSLLERLSSLPDFDFWSKINKVGKPVTVMVAPKSQKLFEHVLEANKVRFEIHIEDVETTIQVEKKRHQSKKAIKAGRITFDQYLRHAEMNAYLDQLAVDYPDVATVETIGQSYEGRDMKVIRISSGLGESQPKPVIFIDAGIHAREWIASPVALYTINQLVENPENSDLVADVDWIILPSLNPDGYEYSWDSDRYWRNTRSVGEKCYGCDANRNFDFHWMEPGSMVDGFECSEIYAGKEPFSEPETRNLRDFFNKTEIAAYITLHSFGEYILYPWGYGDVDILPDNWEELDQLGHDIADAISAVSVRGTNYTVGETSPTLYPAGGASDDWAMGSAGVSIVYTMELPGGGSFGFDPTEEEMQGIVVETFEGFKVLGRYVAQNRK